MNLSKQQTHALPTNGLPMAQDWKSPTPRSVQPAPQLSYRRNVFLNLPIAGRLTLGFVVAALVAALASGVVGIQRAQSLSQQTDFYHSLLQYNTSLTTGRGFLELMDSKLHQTLEDASAPHPSHETVTADIAALNNLATLYGQTLNTYAQNDLLDQHANQQALLIESGDDSLAGQQHTLISSTQRTWQFYQAAQQEILTALSGPTISSAALQNAQLVLQQQGEPTNADALSALHSLIQLNDRLASAVDSATNVEIHNQLLTTLLATACAFLVIALVGWFISETLVRRLRQLHRVTRAVEEGRINERVIVAGRDEIADVSLAVNTMVDTIVGLLEETRQQRDALAGAAEHLFSDMRIVNAGDLRVSAPVGNDPIGVLANAFNFTVGRFRRFILRTQTTVEQLDVVSHQGFERSNAFISLVRSQLRDPITPRSSTAFAATPARPMSSTGPLRSGQSKVAIHPSESEQENSLVQQLQQTQDTLLQTTRDDLNKRLTTTRETIEKASLSIGRLSELISTRPGTSYGGMTEKMVQTQLQELVALEQLLSRLTWDVRQTQFNSANNFTKLDSAFTNLARSAAERPQPATAEVSASLPSVSDTQHQEFVRQAGSFAVEVNALSKRLAAIIQEMRSSITPFRLEGLSMMSEPAKPGAHQSPAEFAQVSSGNLLSNW